MMYYLLLLLTIQTLGEVSTSSLYYTQTLNGKSNISTFLLNSEGLPFQQVPILTNHPREVQEIFWIPNSNSILCRISNRIEIFNLCTFTFNNLFERDSPPLNIHIQGQTFNIVWTEGAPKRNQVLIYTSNLFNTRINRLSITLEYSEPIEINEFSLTPEHIYFVVNQETIFRTDYYGSRPDLVYKEEHGHIRTLLLLGNFIYISTESFVVQISIKDGRPENLYFDSTRASLTMAASSLPPEMIADKKFIFYSNRRLNQNIYLLSRIQVQPAEGMVVFYQYPLEPTVPSISYVTHYSSCTSLQCNQFGGICITKNQVSSCVCFDGWKGKQCIECESKVICNGFGKCHSNNGTCTCEPGYQGNQCQYASCFGVRSDNPSVCSGNGKCDKFDTCTCRNGYFGTKCEHTKCFGRNSTDPQVCSSGGKCIKPNECLCHEGNYGTACESYKCFGRNDTDPNVCSGNGFCLSSNNCWCFQDHFGKQCDGWACFGKNKTEEDVCSGNGICAKLNKCECKQGWTGNTCNEPICYGIPSTQRNVCEGRGKCVRPNQCICTAKNTHLNCSCTSGYAGTTCDEYDCFGLSNTNQSVCSFHGRCDALNHCRCNFGWYGQLCEKEYMSIVFPSIGLGFLFLCLLVVVLTLLIYFAKNTKSVPEEYAKLLDPPKWMSQEQVNLGNHLTIDYKELEFVHKVDEGGYSVVFKGKWNGQVVAIKQMKEYAVGDDPKQWQTLLAEAQILSTLHHPNIISFWGLSVHGQDKYIVTEYVDGVNLHKALLKGVILASEKNYILKQIATGMKYLHTRRPPIIHRDLKSQNVLLKGQEVKICDFGISKSLGDASSHHTQMVGTLESIAPECMDENPKYDEKCDVYSFAILMYEILFETQPFVEVGFKMSLLVSVPKGKRPLIQENWHDLYPDYIVLMDQCWNNDPHKRPGFGQILDCLNKIETSKCRTIKNAKVDDFYMDLNNSINY